MDEDRFKLAILHDIREQIILPSSSDFMSYSKL